VMADDINQKLQDHYGKIYTDAQKFETEVLAKERQMGSFGEKVAEVESGGNEKRTFEVRKVCMTEEGFAEQQFYLQGLLTFFVDAANKIEISSFWHYFLLCEKETGNVAGFSLCYEGHRSTVEFRTKLALFFILPPYQGLGLGSKLYAALYKHYRQHANCYELIVEDANEDFQLVQDIVNSRVLLSQDSYLCQIKEQSKGLLHSPEQVTTLMNEDQTQFKQLSTQLKLPLPILQRLRDLVVFSALESEACNPAVHRAFRLSVKRRLYQMMARQQTDQFKGKR
jgi:GNAT superfamily N-acetyltransferase